MTRTETQNILMSIQAAYPNYKPPDKTIAINTWHRMLEEYTYSQVSAGLEMYILSDTSGFAPSIGQVLDKIHTIGAPVELSEMEAWVLVSRALRNGYYGAEKEFEMLPPLVQKAVGAPSQLRNWAMTDSESVENVIQSNFMRTYRSVLRRENEMAKMPPKIKELIGSAGRKAEKTLEKKEGGAGEPAVFRQ